MEVQEKVHEEKIQEDLARNAADTYTLAHRLCGSCRDMHGLWGYLRIARVVSGVEGGLTEFQKAIGDACADGPKDILIAGAADTGILCAAAQARGARDARYALIDVCPTPLKLCEDFARQWGLALTTQVMDVADLDMPGRFDLVLAHSLLQFLPHQKQLEILKRFAAALRPGGKLIQIFNTSRPIVGGFVGEYQGHYADWVLSQIDAKGIALPAPREQIHAELTRRALFRQDREGTVNSEQDVIALSREAGLKTESCQEIEQGLLPAYAEFVAKIGRRRFLCVCSKPIAE